MDLPITWAIALIVKRKYLQYNKQIVKCNSQLQIRIEELNIQVSQQTVENFTLQAKVISLERQLKQEKEYKSRYDKKALLEADVAVSRYT